MKQPFQSMPLVQTHLFHHTRARENPSEPQGTLETPGDLLAPLILDLSAAEIICGERAACVDLCSRLELVA